MDLVVTSYGDEVTNFLAAGAFGVTRLSPVSSPSIEDISQLLIERICALVNQLHPAGY